jgi:putative ABC transport system substrate-binding protein
MPVIGFIRDGSAESNAGWLAGFHKGLSKTGYVEGQNVTVEYHWLEGKYDRLPELLADLVRRQVAVIASLGTLPTQAAKATTVASAAPVASPRASMVGTKIVCSKLMNSTADAFTLL